MLLDHCYEFSLFAVAFRSEEEVFLRRDPPLVTYFASPWISPWADMAMFMHVPGHEHFIPTKFRKHPLSGSVVKADYVFQNKHRKFIKILQAFKSFI